MPSLAVSSVPSLQFRQPQCYQANQLLVNQSPNGLVNSWKWYKTKLLWAMNDLGQKLAHATGRNDFEYEFYVVLDDDPLHCREWSKP